MSNIFNKNHRGSGLDYNPIVFFGVCVDNDDPLLAGRIRCVDDVSASAGGGKLTDPVGEIQSETELAIKNGLYKKWGVKDPFVHAPFLPISLNVIPKVGEAVKIIYYNPQNGSENKEYIGPLTSQPHKIYNDNYRTGRLHTSLGTILSANTSPPNPESVGSFPNPDDVALVGRKNTDIILGMSYKLPQPADRPKEQSINKDQQNLPLQYPQILIRSGKFIEHPPPQQPSQPKVNDKMTFMQFSTFPNTVTVEEKEDTKTVASEDPTVCIMIEYDVSSPELVDLNSDIPYTGFINVFKLPNITTDGTAQPLKASKLTVDNDISLTPSNQLMRIVLTGKTSTQLKTQMNYFVEDFNKENWSRVLQPYLGEQTPRVVNFNPMTADALQQSMENNPHPLYYRPGPTLRQFFLRSDETTSISTFAAVTNANYNTICDNINKFVTAVTLKGSDSTREGFGLAFSDTKNDVPTKEETKKEKVFNIEENKQQGFITAGAEKIILFSHLSTGTGSTIQLEGNYGINQYQLIDDVEKKTSPSVRGDKLKEFLGKMMDFLESHTHSCPGSCPDTKGTDDKTDVAEVRGLLDGFDETVLNHNIRIN